MSGNQVELYTGRATTEHAPPGGSVISTALLHAAGEGDVQGITNLLAEGAEVNARTSDGWTPLMIAVINGHAGAARLLLRSGADVNARNGKGWTPLRFAVSMADVEAVRLLLSANADVNTGDEAGDTALMQAAGENVVECVRTLLEGGADANLRNRRGETAALLAARAGYVQITELLKSAGAGDGSQEHVHTAANAFDEAMMDRLREAIGETPDDSAHAPAPLESQAIEPQAVESQAVESQAIVSVQPTDMVERLVTALEAMRTGAMPHGGFALSVADISYKFLLTIPEAARLSGLSRNHIAKAVRSGTLKAKKIGRGWRIKRADLDAYVRDLF